ncbi:MAG: hypothetical protein R2845_15565 [Thermomicrobiales bacterium]
MALVRVEITNRPRTRQRRIEFDQPAGSCDRFREHQRVSMFKSKPIHGTAKLIEPRAFEIEQCQHVERTGATEQLAGIQDRVAIDNAGQRAFSMPREAITHQLHVGRSSRKRLSSG